MCECGHLSAVPGLLWSCAHDGLAVVYLLHVFCCVWFNVSTAIVKCHVLHRVLHIYFVLLVADFVY